MVHPHRQCGEEGATVPLQPQEAKRNLACHPNPHKLLQMHSILSGYITAWYSKCTAHNRKALQRVVWSAQRITKGKLPALQDTYSTRCHRKAQKIIKDNNHPRHCLFTPVRIENMLGLSRNLKVSFLTWHILHFYFLLQHFLFALFKVTSDPFIKVANDSSLYIGSSLSVFVMAV